MLVPPDCATNIFPVFFLERWQQTQRPLASMWAPSRGAGRARKGARLRPAHRHRARAPRPGDRSQRGFLVFQPLYRGAAATAGRTRAQLTGFAVAVFRIGDLVDASLRAAGDKGIAVPIIDERKARRHLSSGGDRRGVGPMCGLPTASKWRAPLDAASSSRPPAFPGARRLAIRGSALAAGLVITALLAAYLWSDYRRAAEIADVQRGAARRGRHPQGRRGLPRRPPTAPSPSSSPT